MIRLYTQPSRIRAWIDRHRGHLPLFACVLGFTDTGLISGISAAGATPRDRQYTALADAEFLYHGPTPQPQYPLPPLDAGASPVLISRAVVAAQQIPLYIFDAGLRHPCPVPAIALGGCAAACLTTGNAMPLERVHHLWHQGLLWGAKLAEQVGDGYVILGECVVGGTTTALAVLTALGWTVADKVNSSHPVCNHGQKWEVVHQGLIRWRSQHSADILADPWAVVAALGDPMQIVVAGMAIAASRRCGVLLAGGTQMLAVYGLIQAIAHHQSLDGQPDQILVGTTRWVAEDPTGDTVGLARLLQAPLLATSLSFATSRYAQLRAYEQGYVKEGVGAGGCAIAAHLYQGWEQSALLQAIETLAAAYQVTCSPR